MEKATFRTLCIALLLASTSVFSQGGTDFTGQVIYHYNSSYPLSGVNAYLHNQSGNIVASAVTNTSGYYTFTNVTPGTYTITFSTQQEEGGIELNDAFLVMLKLMNLYTFTPIQTLAADVNNSGTITWTDYFMILIGYLNQGNPFPQPWVFQSITTPIPSPSRSGFTTGGGSSSGDVNGSLVPDPKGCPVFIENPFEEIVSGGNDELQFTLSSIDYTSVAGMQLIFSVPEVLDISDIECSIPDASIFNDGSYIRVTWLDNTMAGMDIDAGSPILNIRAHARTISRDSETYSLKLREDSHFIDADGNIISGLKLSLPSLKVNFREEIPSSAYPNPFASSATLEFSLPADGQVIVSLYDQAGREVKEIANGYFTAGQHNVKLDGTGLFPGIYHYTIRLADQGQNFTVGTIIKSK